MDHMGVEVDLTGHIEAELTAMSEDPEYWTKDSTLGDFSYEEFLT